MSDADPDATYPRAWVLQFLRTQRLLGPHEAAVLNVLSGGVSSEIWRVELPQATVCIKRALPQLKVAYEWLAPVSRNRVERDWLVFAASVCPGQVPGVVAHDDELGGFAMDYLPPERYPVWKDGLLRGIVDADTASAVGELVGRLHSRSVLDPTLATRFATDGNFDALRIEPYLRVTARAHPDLADRFADLASRTATTHLALVHGDVSPKNILVGPTGPVLLDAECAWFGDPAFDVSFCLNHLLIKSVVHPHLAAAFHAAANALIAGHRRHLDWEDPAAFAARTSSLVPALTLARVDGASPVEYLTAAQRDTVRHIGRTLLADPPSTGAELLARWALAANGS